MSYNVLIFTESNKPDINTCLTISDRLKWIYGYYTKTIQGNFYVVVRRKTDVRNVTTFCYGVRELWTILKGINK